MNFAMIVDGCVQRSYYVKDKKSYRFNTDEPYSHHHSIGNECHLGIWGWPFLFDGYFLNWTEFEELPTLDLDVIMVAIEKNPDKYNVDILRKKYPNATIVSFIKEDYWINSSLEQRVNFFKSCDIITFPWNVQRDNNGISVLRDANGNVITYSVTSLGIDNLTELCGKQVHYVPQPHDVDFLYDRYFQQEKQIKILNYKAPEKSPGEDTESFVDYISKKYEIPTFQHVVKYSGPECKQWEQFLEGITSSLYCFNLDPVKTGGSMAVQCASLGILNIGGLQDSHEILFSETATNEWERLEEVFQKIHSEPKFRDDVISYAFNKARSHYSHESVRKRFLEVVS